VLLALSSISMQMARALMLQPSYLHQKV